jgi:peroxiredoxin
MRESLPSITVRDLEGREHNLREYKGKKLILYVWSRTCAGHSRDLRLLNEIVDKKGEYTVISYAVAMEPEDVRKSYEELGIKPRFITLIDTGVRFNDYIPITFLPSTYLFDRDGRLIKSSPGLFVP